jgi:hypothetical protein
MNIKLLKELSKQAETECGWSEEKFAELIVRECANIAADAEQSKGGMPAKYHVLDHFGVAE